MRVGEAFVLSRQLPAVETLDPVARELKRRERFAVTGLHRLRDFIHVDPKPRGVDIKPVEFLRGFDQRHIATGSDIFDDAPAGRLDIGGGLALHRQEAGERVSEIGAGGVEQNRHGGFPNVFKS